MVRRVRSHKVHVLGVIFSSSVSIHGGCGFKSCGLYGTTYLLYFIVRHFLSSRCCIIEFYSTSRFHIDNFLGFYFILQRHSLYTAFLGSCLVVHLFFIHILFFIFTMVLNLTLSGYFLTTDAIISYKCAFKGRATDI